MKLSLQKHIRWALLYFFIAASLGVVMRWFAVIDIPATFRYLVHTHSHIALLGWVYLALLTLLYHLFLQSDTNAKAYHRIFWFTQLTLIGMLFTFPFQGYAVYSIIFSTLFLFASYFFANLFLKKTSSEHRNRFSFKLIRWAIWFMVFSSIGPWALGIIMSTLGNTSVWYKLAIYFYLHFQYNGWFIPALLGILFYFLENKGFALEQHRHKKTLWLMNSSVVLTFFLSTLFTEPHFSIYILAGIGALLQTIVFVLLFLWIFPRWKSFSKNLKKGVAGMLLLSGILLGIKSDLQFLSAIPYVAKLAFFNLDFVIGYLHLVFLGVVTIALFAMLKQSHLTYVSAWGYRLFISAFLITEILIFYKGMAIWLGWPLWSSYYTLLAIGSILFPISLAVMLISSQRNSITKTTG